MKTDSPRRTVVAVAALLLAALLSPFQAPTRGASAQVGDTYTARGLIDSASTTTTVTASGSTVVDIPGLVVSYQVTPSPVSRCIRLVVTGRMQATVDGTTGDVNVVRTDLDTGRVTTIAGVSEYVAHAGGAGGMSYVLTALDALYTDGTFSFKAVLKRTAGPGAVSNTQTGNFAQEMTLEDLGIGPAFGVVGACDGAVE